MNLRGRLAGPSSAGVKAPAHSSSSVKDARGSGGGSSTQDIGSDSTLLNSQEQEQQQQQQQQQRDLELLRFKPAWERPSPGVLPPFVDELLWLSPDLHTGLVWDSSMGEDVSRMVAVRELLNKAMRGPLLPAQQQQVRGHICGVYWV